MSTNNRTAEENSAAIPSRERTAFLRTLAWLAAVDQHVAEEERSYLLKAAAAIGGRAEDAERALAQASRIETLGDAVRGLRSAWVRTVLLHHLLVIAFADGRYTASERVGIRRLARAMNVPLHDLERLESGIAADLKESLMAGGSGQVPVRRGKRWSRKRVLLVGGAALGATALSAITAGFAAPAIGGALGSAAFGLSGAAATKAGLAFLGGGALAQGGLGMAGGTAAIQAFFGTVGGASAARRVTRRTAALKEFKPISLGGTSGHLVIGVPGFLNQQTPLEAEWEPLSRAFPLSERYVIRWESQTLLRLGESIGSFVGHPGAHRLVAMLAKRATRTATKRLGPLAVASSLLSTVDNAWFTACDRAPEAGALLGDLIADGYWGHRPVTLAGFSLGSLVCLKAVERLEARGENDRIDGLILMGGATSAGDPMLRRLHRAVHGPSVNLYCRRDLVLRVLYQATRLARPIGLQPLGIEGLLDVAAPEGIDGHLAYTPRLEQALELARAASDAAVLAGGGSSGREFG